MKLALVGLGQVAEKAHMPALAKRGHEVVAVCENTPSRMELARTLLPSARIYSSLDLLLANERSLDFVDIATPPFLHADQTLACLKAGVHVLCEKPLALSPEPLDLIRRTATMAGRSAFTVHNWAYSPQWLKIWELADRLGAVRHVELRALRTQPALGALPDDWRRQAEKAGGGVLVDHGWHNLYLLRRLIPLPPSRVTARLGSGPGAVDDEATVFIEYPDASALVHLTWRSSLRRNSATISGTEGLLELRDDELVLERADAPAQTYQFDAPLSAGSAHPGWFEAMLPDFEAELADPAKRGRNLEEAAFAAAVIHRVYQAQRFGRNPLRSASRPNERTRA